jgi:phosphoesterase RecJ-like protein
MYPEAEQIGQIVEAANKVVIIQADNPDADSIGSALALEHILGDLGKDTYLYCGVEMPNYLRYMAGWDRVHNELPSQFDASIIVDASTMTLLEKLSQSGQQGWVSSKPCIVLDHHEKVDNLVTFATVMLNDFKRASAGELIYTLSKQLGWRMSVEAQGFIMNSILGDTQGLTNSLASAETYKIFAEMVEAGVNRPALEETRREYGKMAPEIFKYKAELIKRTEFSDDGKLTTVVVPQDEINTYSPLYNPVALIHSDTLQTTGVQVSIVFKSYDDGKITGAIRSNQLAPVAGQVAGHFGGGGHAFAAGFKITDGRPIDEVKNECISLVRDLLAKIETEKTDETVQHANQTD